jgi:hypothetical protein
MSTTPAATQPEFVSVIQVEPLEGYRVHSPTPSASSTSDLSATTTAVEPMDDAGPVYSPRTATTAIQIMDNFDPATDIACYALVLSLCHASIFSCIYLIFFTMCTTSPPFSASTGLTSDLAVISILSSYVPIMHYVTHFPLLYRLSHVYISFLLMTLPDFSSLYTSRVTHCSTY